MEREEQKWEEAEVEEQEEEDDETALLLRKSIRNGYDSKTTEIAAVDAEVSDGVSESNGHAILSNAAASGAENEELKAAGEKQKTEELLDVVLENEELKAPGEKQKIEELLDVVLENEELKAPGEKQKIEELNGVLEKKPEAVNGEYKQDNLVFYDKVEGIWKCRICSWTYRNGSDSVPHIQNHKGQLHKLMNLKTLIFESEGSESTSTYFGEKQIVIGPGPKELDASSLSFIVQNNSTSAINNRHEGDPQISFQERSTSYNSSIEIESAEVDLINGDDLEEVTEEFDVKRVLEKQNTHDLYCPNCNSCITRRVILRKRKRRIRVSDEEVKRNRTEAAVDSKLSTFTSQSSRDQVPRTDEVGDNYTQIPTVNEDERDRGPDIFRCLSCFSCFIPTGDGFKLFRIFGEKSGRENDQNEQVPRIKKNWFTSMFASNKQETAVEQGSSFQTDVQRGDVGVIPSTSLLQKASSHAHTSEGLVGTPGKNDTLEGDDNILPFPKEKPSINGKVIVGAGDRLDTTATETIDARVEQFDAYSEDQLKESKTSKKVNINRESDLSVTTLPMRTQVTNGESAGDAISFSQQGGLKLLVSSNKGSTTLENSRPVQNQTLQSGDSDKEAIQLPPTSVSVLKTSDMDGKLNISLSIPHEEQDVRATILTETYFENKTANFRSGDSGQVHPTEVSHYVINKTKFGVHSDESLKVDHISVPKDAPVTQGKDTVITIDERPTGSSQTVQDIIHPTDTENLLQTATQISIAGRERTEARKELEIEVVKSIVYGGLAESITSLSVVSSAAGGGAGTLNILALGAANLIGGLFIICHNLLELRSDRIEQVSTQISGEVLEQRDRYKELLGRRQNFVLHAIIAITSYLIFGLVPPLAYGFSFRKTDDKQLKLVVVAAASLVCIVMLAIGRAYVRRPPKPYLNSVITFVILGLMVSGVSYVAGELVERLLEKLGLFQTSSVSNLFAPEMELTGSGWGSY